MRAWLFLIVLTGCQAKNEARNVVAAVAAFREASNDAKPAKADALDQVECTDKEVCDVKAACTKSADATAKGLRLQADVQAHARDTGPYPDDLADKWKEASADLAMGYGLLEECRNKTQALKDRFNL